MRLRQLELMLKAQKPVLPPKAASVSPSSPADTLDIGKQLPLVPTFREAEIDSYFASTMAAQCVATAITM